MLPFRGRALVLAGLTVLALGGTACGVAPGTAPSSHPDAVLYPGIEPLRSGHLPVSDLHELYWETVGNPDGIPAIVLHGGPGGIAGPRMRRFFDPERFHVLLFDQRGAVRSRPPAEWRENTTQDLVSDINLLRDHVGMEGPALLFGGSWGTTLAVAYAEAYPELVSGMVLRGVFLGTRAEIDHFYHGGTAVLFPENWERLRALLPHPERLDYHRQLFEMITGDDRAQQQAAVEGWAWYELRMSSLDMTDEQADDLIRRYRDSLRSFSLLENFYMMNDCFLAEGQLLRDAGRIAHIPTFIVHGRFDAICAPRSAYDLSRRLDRVRLEFTQAGHAQGEPPTTEALVRGVEWVADQAEE
jgi:proline iminopeptidase